MFGFVTAIIIALIASWELTLVLMFVFPVLGSVSYLQLKFIAGRSAKNKKKQESSGQTAVESIENIRTVAGLGVEDRFFDKYVQLLKGPFKLVFQTCCIDVSLISFLARDQRQAAGNS